MTLSQWRRRPHRISYVNQRLNNLGTPTGHNIQMIVNDEEALIYMEQSEEPGFIELVKFIATHNWAFKNPDVGKRAHQILNEAGELTPDTVTITLQVPASDSHDLMQLIQAHFEIA